MPNSTGLLGYRAAITAASLICDAARIEIATLSPDQSAERYAIRSMALRAIGELYFRGLTVAAMEKLRRVQPPAGRAYLTGRDALVDLAGWDSVP